MERLLSGVVDFAGTFPPANLSVVASLDRYLRAHTGPESVLLGRYVCSTAQLGELASALVDRRLDSMVPVSAVGMPAHDRKTWEAGLARDAETMNEFHRRTDGRAEIQAYEVRVPESADVETYVQDLRGFGDAEVYVELPLNDRIDDAMARLADADDLGAKLRTGGLEVSAIPSSRALAQFLRSCVELEIPFKLTAGLHHPLPAYDRTVGGRTHGFLNVLTATALGLSEDISRREMEQVLEDADPDSWRFDDQGMRWREFGVDLADIAETRELFVAFGSCSIDEPVQDLGALFGTERAGVK
jgi:hypothetical protein